MFPALIDITWIGLELSYFLIKERNIVLILPNRLKQQIMFLNKKLSGNTRKQICNTKIVDFYMFF